MPRHDHYVESHLGGGAVLRHKRPAQSSTGIDLDPNVIGRWRRESPDLCTLVLGDAAQFLANTSIPNNTLVYADPPYWPSSRRRRRVYRCDYGAAQHLELLQVLLSLDCMVMLSGYENSEYDRLLANWRKVTFAAKTHSGVRTECVWMNFDPPAQLHDGSLLGDTFREREVMRRRHARWLSRFADLPAPERSHLLELLNGRYPNVGSPT